MERLVQRRRDEQKQERTSREAGRGKVPAGPPEAAGLPPSQADGRGGEDETRGGLPAVSPSGLPGRNPRGVVRCLRQMDGHVFLQAYVTSRSHWSHPLPARRKTNQPFLAKDPEAPWAKPTSD